MSVQQRLKDRFLSRERERVASEASRVRGDSAALEPLGFHNPMPLIRPSGTFSPGGGEGTEYGRSSSINPAGRADFVPLATARMPNLCCDEALVLRNTKPWDSVHCGGTVSAAV